MARDSRPRAPLATFLIIQAVLGCWWAAFYPGLFSRDSVLYLSHTVVGPWVSDHSVVYDALLWLSFTGTGDLGAVTFAQTTAMAGALTYLARSLAALGAPRLLTTVVAVLMPLAPPVGAFAVTLWKDVPFTICAVVAAGVCARIAARRAVTGPALLGLAASLAALGLFRANGFLVAGVAVLVLMVIVRTARVRLLVAGGLAAALPLVLSTVVFPHFGITPASNTYVYHTAFGDIAVAYREHPELFTDRDRALMESVAPLTRWREGGTCHTVNPLIWRRDFSWTQADARAGELLSLWRRLLVSDPATIVSARVCRGSIAWRPLQDEAAVGGGTYRFSLRPNADTYVGPGKVADFPGRSVYSLRPLSMRLNDLADRWLTAALAPRYDWALWRGASWAYLSYLSVALAAWALRNQYALAVAAVVAGQQLAVLANISAQDFRYMAAPILVGMLLVPLLLGSLARLLAELVRTLWRRLRGAPARPEPVAPLPGEPEPVVPLATEPEDDPTEPLPEPVDETDEPTEPLEEDTAPMPVPPEAVSGPPPGTERND
ncbi:hypothetical protein [Nonomuraea aridisoli]|uniref:Glycosyltransferase RgtA/B/C/D-like domain-containing protein n=1 Tax=Nonomuraea aridisoli TaxID=2070368 RepID=A0A2W2DMU6_9ACTN|nr:hypothetical protein [Nonomuraea aridisoli]PZG13282.1 hypothetical protein C1J01_30430 [Nonomuraea aridisoli]